MSRHATDFQGSVQESVPSPPLPAGHVLHSAAVLFPGAFDQHGCPLIVFPAEEQAKLSSELGKAEVVDFINYFLCMHNKKQEKESLVSVVADLRHASLPTTRFVAETLLLLEHHKRRVHSVYIIQPKKKDAAKLLLKLLTPSKSHTVSFKKVLLKEIPELSNYIDRSQLTASLGGYLIYCHQSWVAFIKEIDEFVQEFLSVVQRLPSCISTLKALSRLQPPSTFSELRHFCSTNEAKFLQLRRELGLDKLLTHCEGVVEKLRYPEKAPCYQAMAGTALFTHTAFDMLQNHSRITAAVEKVELLWHQAFSKARLQLQVFQLKEDALQITEQIKTLLQEKLQPYKIEIAKDAGRAVMLVSEFEASIHTPAMTLVRCAEEVIHTVAEILLYDGQTRERWVLDVERLKERLYSAVKFILQTLRAVSSYHQYYNKADSWYRVVLCENILQMLLSGVNGDGVQRRNWGTIPAWRYKLSSFLKKNPPPDVEELVHLAHLSNAVPDDEVQEVGKQMSRRCMALRKLLMSSGPVAVGQLQLALQWQYELLRSSCVDPSSADGATNGAAEDVQDYNTCESGPVRSTTAVAMATSAEAKPPSLSSFDSGFDGQLEACGVGTRDLVRPAVIQPQIHKENLSSVSDPEDHREGFDVGSVGNSSGPSIQIVPKVTVDSLNLEIKVKRSAALPNNPWLSLPVDDLENSYTVTITQNPTPLKKEPRFLPHDPSTDRSRDQPMQTEVLRDWTMRSESSLEDPELSPVRNILSSTITDGRDKSICTAEGIPTLLWDSYDLHHQNQDAVDGEMDISLNDWDVKEQEDLKEVEKILVRADEILEKEESVLAQEAVLDALLRSEERHHQWPMWDTEDQLGVMSSSELAEAGVLGLEDYLDPAESDHLGSPGSAGSESETKASEAADGAFHSRPDLLTELRKVHILEELIMEENLKIHELRRCEENPKEDLSVGEPPDTNKPPCLSKEREAFQLQLQKEKREVEKLEESLDEERKAKKHKDRARKVVKCSVLDRARSENKEDQALCDELLSGRCRSQRTHSKPLDQNDSQETQENDNIREVSGSDVAKESTPHDLIRPPDSQCQDDCSLAFIGATSDLKEAPEEEGIQPEGCIYGNKLDKSPEDASLISGLRPDDGGFDPGGKPHLPPVPEPKMSPLPVNHDDLAEHQPPPHSTELQDPAQPSVAQDPGFALPENSTPPLINHDFVLNPNVKEHSNNNNNHALTEKLHVSLDRLSEITTKGEEDASVAPECLIATDLHPAEDVQTLSAADEQSAPQLPPDRPLEFDPGGGDEQREGFQRSEVMRISGSGSPGIQAQLNINTREMTDFKTPIVLDTGSGLMKAGFADQDLPNIIFPTIIGMPKYEEIMNGNLEREIYIGHGAQHMRGVLALKHPIKNGIINNWDEMEKIWHHTFQQLCVDPEDHPVLLTEAAMNPMGNRQRMVEIMFECFNVPFTYVAMQAVLALYAAGRTSGVVFDSGDGVSHSVPVFEGYCLPHAVQRFPLAGGDVTMHLKKLLQEQGVCMRTTAEMEIVREIKERCCCVAVDYEAELSRGGESCREMHYTMPDGQIVTLATERFRAPEILFKPELIGRDHYGMHESVFKSILSSDIDLRRCFLGNIVLSGGNTLLPGLPERLQAEIRGLVPAAEMRNGVRVTSPEDRDFSVWSGGAVLANLPAFSAAWISQEEYEEHGPQIVFRKCF
ncbi:uncharacterized protein LOC129106788 [Anoplopoma fimbria]|uniref:uncharacterized protein LOC129106788 n=1 Tax=Anoplopoma fimbria TaxID=229290 RepID=UPI0023ECB653|nr:uncharacterized protein LOC129106788 [Anoplopoma fimbria]